MELKNIEIDTTHELLEHISQIMYTTRVPFY